MYNNKRFLAIITARSGSKGLKDKNIMDLNGKPMMAYTIEAAHRSGIFDDVIVSTDSQQYAQIAEDCGADVPFLRPDELATDQSSSTDVLLYTLDQLKQLGKEYDYFVLLQPTSPLRTSEDISNAVKLLFEKEGDSIVSVCEAEHSPLWCNTLTSDLSMKDFLNQATNKRRQDLGKFYRINGALYISKVTSFIENQTFYTEKAYAYIMHKFNSVDIDDIYDFKYVEFLLQS